MYVLPGEPERFVRLETYFREYSVLGLIVDVTEDIRERRRIEQERDIDLLTRPVQPAGVLPAHGGAVRQPQRAGGLRDAHGGCGQSQAGQRPVRAPERGPLSAGRGEDFQVRLQREERSGPPKRGANLPRSCTAAPTGRSWKR